MYSNLYRIAHPRPSARATASPRPSPTRAPVSTLGSGKFPCVIIRHGKTAPCAAKEHVKTHVGRKKP